jgi:hypothetical protein
LAQAPIPSTAANSATGETILNSARPFCTSQFSHSIANLLDVSLPARILGAAQLLHQRPRSPIRQVPRRSFPFDDQSGFVDGVGQPVRPTIATRRLARRIPRDRNGATLTLNCRYGRTSREVTLHGPRPTLGYPRTLEVQERYPRTEFGLRPEWHARGQGFEYPYLHQQST